MIERRHFLRLAAAASAASVVSRSARPQSFPDRPIRLIVPFAPGGPNDVVARLVASEAFKNARASFVVENIPGGAGNAGIAAAARAPADGHTLVFVTSSFMIQPGLQATLQYDPVKSFAPVTMIAAAPHVLVVHPSFPALDMKEFIAFVRSKPRTYGFASAGTGQSSHLAGELFKIRTGLDLVHVPFNGAAPAMNSTLGGHTPIAFISLPAAARFIKEGQLRALATTGRERSEAFPDLPTMAEAGLPDQVSVFMQGALLPAGTPRNIVDQWYREIDRLMRLPEIRQRVAALGLEPIVNTPDEFSAEISSEIRRWSHVIRAAQITINQ
jgi:tripartite-type tricarboxylate transporter receptor subunit TctC